MKLFRHLLLLLFIIINIYLIESENELNIRSLNSKYDNLRSLFIAVRRLNWFLSDTTNNLYQHNLRNGKTQKIVKNSTNFFCDTINGPGRRSLTPPTSVHKLHPGDIDIIAAMGDSISAGNAAISVSITHLMNEYRSISWSGGGHGTWRQFFTLPNILKEFNPKLYGYAIGNGLSIDKISRLNIAEPMALSPDMPYQARALINRMRADANVDMKNHWKILTIFIGSLDFCTDLCYHDTIEEWADLHEEDLIKTLRILRDNVPRLLVNLVSFPNMLEIDKANKGLICYISHHTACYCLYSSKMNKMKLKTAIRMWQQKDIKIGAMDEFNTEDFAVIAQPFLTEISLINKRTGVFNWKFLASDCMHFSQKANALAAINLWKNMLQPVGTKQTSITNDLVCPTKEHPYIATNKNSKL